MFAIDHLDLVVTSLERSLDFYRGLLEPLGYVRVSEIEGERGERVVYVGRVGERGEISLREAQSDAHAGIKLEIVHRPSESDLVAEVRRLAARLERLERGQG